jgi:D-galactarolactone cycloisomerase
VASTIIEDLLAPALVGMPFDGEIEMIESLWRRMYDTMRVRGQTGGFMLDAISGVDLALWDLVGKLRGQPIAALLAGKTARSAVRGYLSGLSGSGLKERVEFARRHQDQGFTLFKIFYDGGEEELRETLDALRSGLGGSADLAVDALWRLQLPGSERLLRELEARRLVWLKCPFPPDEIAPHRELRLWFSLPVAAGEPERTGTGSLLRGAADAVRAAGFRACQKIIGSTSGQ